MLFLSIRMLCIFRRPPKGYFLPVGLDSFQVMALFVIWYAVWLNYCVKILDMTNMAVLPITSQLQLVISFQRKVYMYYTYKENSRPPTPVIFGRSNRLSLAKKEKEIKKISDQPTLHFSLAEKLNDQKQIHDQQTLSFFGWTTRNISFSASSFKHCYTRNAY